MSTRKKRFHLSAQGQLRWAIAGLCVLPHWALANGITVADGPGGTAQLLNQGGVPIVNIVAPNAGGLSHNQFLDYNVDRQGAVLNNALQAGQSQLAGQLAGNPQFHGQAASVILNEVVGAKASALNGRQEVFGRQADYVLANPNGISVNGGGFINAGNASLVVGRPDVANGTLQALDSGAARGQLQVQGGGLSNPDGAIRLIAPQIDSQGPVTARDRLDLVVGRNRVDAASGQVSKVYPPEDGGPARIDASLFGAMKAGRINIVSTAEGAGVHIGPGQVSGTEGVSVSSAGDLVVSGQAHANSLDASRAVVQSRQGDVELHSARDLSLAGADISGGNVRLDAGRNLTLSSLESTALQEKHEQWQNKALFVTYETFDRTTRDRDSRQHGTRVEARHDARLSSAGDTLVKASSVEAGDQLRIDSGASLRLTAATETHETRDQGSHRKHLWKENWDNSRHDERSVTSSLKAGKGLELTSRDTLQLAGAELTSPGDIRLKARDVAIGSASRSQSSSGNHYSGDLVGGSFFGRQGDADQGQTLHTGSRVNADGKLIVQADSVHVSASQVRGGTQASVISDSGALVIDGVQDTLRSNTHDKDSKFFSLINDERHQVRSDSNLVASDLHSDSNLELQSAGDITVSGSRVSANGQNTLAAKGDIHLVAGESSVQDDTRTHSRGFTAGAGETTPGSHEYRLAVGLKDQQQQRISDNRQQQGASVSGANLAVNAGGDLRVKGSDLAATAGDVRLSGQHIDLLAAHDTADSRTDTLVNAGGVVWTASLDKVSSGLEYQRQHQQDSRNQSTARPTGVTATHNVLLQAADALVNQGTQIEAGKQLRVEAGRVDNQAAHTTDSTSHSEQGWQAGLGVSAEIKGLSRPLEKVVKGLGQGKLPEGEWLKGIELAGVGLDGLVGYNAKQQTRQDSTAVVSQLNAGAVQLNVRGALQDEGTRYRAGDGALNIKAASHNAIAASDSHQSSEQGVEARLGLRVYTTTGEDVNLRANGAGKYQRAEETRSSAQVGRYAGSQGVSIQTRNDARYAGGEFDGGAGDVSLKAGGTLALNQATDSHSRSSSTLGATASLKLETAKDGGFTPGGELKPQIQYQSEQGSEARIASVQGQGRLQLAGATVDGEVLKGDEPQRLQAGIDQPIN